MFAFLLNSNKSVRNGQKTEKEAKKLLKHNYNTWKNIISYFDKDLKSFNEKHIENLDKLKGSLVYVEMTSFTKRLAIVQNLANWGFYHSSLQELRFLMDTAILAYYLDQQLPNTEHSEKIQLMQKHKGELWGVRLRRRSYIHDKELGAEVESVITEINNSIDQYLADNTFEVWAEETVPFKEAEFMDCVNHTKNACALIIKHFMKSFADFSYSGEMIVTHSKEETIESTHLDED
ncbi:MAG: hypothetical protein ACTSSK_11135 [Candidatus Heimdallarchaeota archaeon]